MSEVIPDAAVEAAAKAIWARTRVDSLEDSADYLAVEVCRHDARLALEAAAPHMMASAWSTCAVESARCGLLSAADALLLANRNPYKNEA